MSHHLFGAWMCFGGALMGMLVERYSTLPRWLNIACFGAGSLLYVVVG